VRSSGAESPSCTNEAGVRRGIELLYFGYGQLTRAADRTLAVQGLGRAHHRALYFIAREPDLTVTALLKRLAITKQSLGRVLNELVRRGLVEARPGDADRRQKRLRLTDPGHRLEAELLECLREPLAAAYAGAGGAAVTGFWAVLEGLVMQADGASVSALPVRG
jgi:DNA-binding MarR family transcriptional regulator